MKSSYTFNQLISAVWMTVAVSGPCSFQTLVFALQMSPWDEDEARLKKAILELQKREIIALSEYGEYDLRWDDQEASFEGL
jgi:hypothetical protein